MNKDTVKVRFPNESTWVEMLNFEWDEFKMNKEYDTELFGWYKGIYVAIVKNNRLI
jgi:hypothetical protein